MNSQRQSPVTTRSKILLLHAALSVTILLGGAYWAIQVNDRAELPMLRATARFVRPTFNDERVISDDQLALSVSSSSSIPAFKNNPRS